MTQQQQFGIDQASKVDVHVLHMPDEINIIGDLNDPHIVVHHLEGVKGNTLAGRIAGFSAGTESYVSFVDPDDEVNLSAFKTCIDELDADPSLAGVYTNSLTTFADRDDLPDRMRYRSDHKWSISWMRAALPIHQLVVMRRSIVTQAIENLMADTCPETRTVLAEQLIYLHVALLAPFKFLDINGYTWYCRQNAGHNGLPYDKKIAVRDYMWKLLDTVSPR